MQMVPSSWVVKQSAQGNDDGAISIWQDPSVAPVVGRIMEHSCADCHSNLTHWPWYSRVAPASWLLARHVGQGREKLDLSEWAVLGKDGAIVRSTNEAEEICDAVANHSMPLASYTLFHPSSRLSESDRQSICAWSNQLSGKATSPAFAGAPHLRKE